MPGRDLSARVYRRQRVKTENQYWLRSFGRCINSGHMDFHEIIEHGKRSGRVQTNSDIFAALFDDAAKEIGASVLLQALDRLAARAWRKR